MITDIARGEADLDTLKAGASLIPAGKVIKLPKVIKAIGNVGKTGFKKGKEGEKIAKSSQAKQTKARDKGDGGTEIQAGDKTPGQREYTQHGAQRANERGFDSQKIDSIIDNNYNKRVKEIDRLTGEVTWRYQDKRGNTVITNEWDDKIVTVYSHPEYVNGGNYIPKS